MYNTKRNFVKQLLAEVSKVGLELGTSYFSNIISDNECRIPSCTISIEFSLSQVDDILLIELVYSRQ